MEDILKIRDVAAKWKIKESTLRAWVFQEKIPVVRIGRLVRFRPSEIEKWLGQNEQKCIGIHETPDKP